MTLPLAGIQAIDLTDERGAFAARLLADLGADVVRVEPPGGGRLRSLAPFLDDVADVERGLQHLYLNANKRSVTADYRTTGGAALVARLAEGADILVESEPPGVLREAGLGYDALAERNPGLVYCSITPFGQHGPWNGRRGNDLIGNASGGLSYVSGPPDGTPWQAGGDQAYKMAGLIACTGVMVALTGRDADPDGRGNHLDVSIQEAVAMTVLQTSNPSHWHWYQRIPRRPGLTAVHRTADGRYVTMYLSRNRVPQFLEWGRALGIAQDISEETLDNAADLMEAGRKAAREIAARVTADEFLSEAVRRDIWSLPMQWLPDMKTSEHMIATRQFRDVPNDVVGRDLSFPRSTVDAAGPDLPISRAPRLGEHTDEVLAELERARPAVSRRAAAADLAFDPDRPLAGIRVLDFCWVLAGPLGSRILSNWGAEVIRVEAPYDRWFPDVYPPGNRRALDLGGFHNIYDIGKRSVTIDPTTPAGRDILLRLAETCDVVTNNYRPGALAEMGLGYEALRERNPGIVVLHMPGCGSTGPWAGRPTLGNMIAAAGGINALSGFPDRSPRGIGVAYPDFTSPYVLATSVLAALRHVRRTGEGRELDLSQLSATVSLIGVEWLQYTTTGTAPGPRQNRDPNWCPHGIYRAAGEDEWVAVAVQGDEQWRRLCEVIGRGDLADDARFATHGHRKGNEDELDKVVEAWTVQHDKWDAADLLQDRGLAAAAVEHLRDALERDPNLSTRTYQRIRRPDAPDVEIITQGDGIRFASSDHPIPLAPTIGEHNAYVCMELLGLSGEDFAHLLEEGVIR